LTHQEEGAGARDAHAPPVRRHPLRDACPRSGLRRGTVAFVVAELVGSSGEVVGVDQSGESMAQANSRAREQSAGNVSFYVGDIHDVVGEGRFDAIVGR
jgi:Methyltransferase domain